jgi:hypothetical protein
MSPEKETQAILFGSIIATVAGNANSSSRAGWVWEELD